MFQLILTIIGILMALYCAYAWFFKELRPVFTGIRHLPLASFSDKMLYPFRWIYHLVWGGRFFWIDIVVTSALISGINLGFITIGFAMGGFIGTIMGLTISNVLSFYLIRLMEGKIEDKDIARAYGLGA